MELYREEALEIEAYQSLTPEQKKSDIRDVNLIAQKYKNLRKEIEKSPLPFYHSNFRIEPASGTVWPGSCLDIKVYFTPDKAGEVISMGYCDVQGRETRLHLQVKVGF